MLRAEHVDAFLISAFEVLAEQAQARPDRGSPVLRGGASYSSRELTGMVAIAGDLAGVCCTSMSLATAAKLWAQTDPDGAHELDRAADEAVLQTARDIAEGGVERLRRQGCECHLDEAVLVYGFGEPLTEVSPMLIVPLYTRFGDMDIGIAMQPAEALPEGMRLISARAAALQPPAPEPPTPEQLAPEEPAGEDAPAAEPVDDPPQSEEEASAA